MARRIVLDIDGVLYNFAHGVQYMWAKRAGFKDREDFKLDTSRWDLGVPKEDWEWVTSKPQTEYLFRHAHLYSGAIEFVYDLAELGDISLVTNRTKDAMKPTLQWILFNFDHEDREWPFTEVRILGEDVSKRKVLADIYIDDRLSNLLEVDGLRILVDRPWNQFNLTNIYSDTGIVVRRAYTFEDVLRSVEECR